MKYFLDFDRTLYDTDAFKKAVAKRPTLRQLIYQLKEIGRGLFTGTNTISKRRTFTKTLGTFLSHGRFMFTPEELKEFLYPDVAEFVATHTCTVVTYGVQAFITAKVAAALTDLPFEDIVYTSRKKGRTIKRLCVDQDGPFTFIDDALFQLVSVSGVCPQVTVIEMRRDGGKGDGRWPVIHSLNEIPT